MKKLLLESSLGSPGAARGAPGNPPRSTQKALKNMILALRKLTNVWGDRFRSFRIPVVF